MVKLCEHPKYTRYFKMLNRGMEKITVQRIMLYDGLDPSILDQDPNDLEEVEEEKESNSLQKEENHHLYIKELNKEDPNKNTANSEENGQNSELMIET